MKEDKRHQWLRLFLNIHEHIHNRWCPTLFLVASVLLLPNPSVTRPRPICASFRPSSHTWKSKHASSFAIFYFQWLLHFFIFSNMYFWEQLLCFRNALLTMKKHLHHKVSGSCDPGDRSPKEKGRSQGIRNLLILISLSIIPYLSCLGGDFVFDDAESIVNNPIVNGKDPLLQVIYFKYF